MKFYAEPNLYVRISERYRRFFPFKGFRFDENGVFETEHERLIRLMKQNFQYEEKASPTEETPNPENNASTSETIQPKAFRKCKKCDFTCDSQGELLRHYRAQHPKQ